MSPKKELEQKIGDFLIDRLHDKKWCKTFADSYSKPNFEKARIQAEKELIKIPNRLNSLSKEEYQNFYNYFEEKVNDPDWMMDLDSNFYNLDVDLPRAIEKAYFEFFGQEI